MIATRSSLTPSITDHEIPSTIVFSDTPDDKATSFL